MDERLDLVGEVLVLGRHGQGHPQRQLQREGLIVPVDGAEVDGSLKAVGGTHGVSPYRSYGVLVRAFLSLGQGERYPGAESLGKSTSYLVHPASLAHQLASARSFFAIVFAETRTRDSLKIPEKWGFSGAWDMPAPSNAWGKT